LGEEVVEIVLWGALGFNFKKTINTRVIEDKPPNPIIRFNNLLAKLSKSDPSKVNFHSCDKWHLTEWIFYE
jgi:hypothetical protein